MTGLPISRTQVGDFAQPRILGRLVMDGPHECHPSEFHDERQGRLYANHAVKGTVWRCSCGSLYVNHGEPMHTDWQPATHRERKQIEREGLAPLDIDGTEPKVAIGGPKDGEDG